MITLEQANAIIAAILARGRELDLRPLAVVVTEPGAIVKAFQKEDHGAMIRFEMAYGKAYAALALGRSSSLVRARTEQRPLFMDYLIKASGEKIFPEGGGQLIRDADGNVIGAVGVTGDTQERDDELALYGIRAAALLCDEDCASLGNKVRLD
ncbi:MAG: heme-binding protein [Rhodospirillales bacterium]